MSRVRALLSKELTDLRQNPGVFAPAILTGTIALALPFLIAIGIPYATGERLSDSSDFRGVVEAHRAEPSPGGLDAEGAVQAWIFQQFLVLLALSPVAASMSVAAASIVGEKQARTLEPLLATPLTTFELLAAKVLGALLPALALTILLFVSYLAGIGMLAGPGVARALLAPQPLATMFVVAPLAALAALQLAVCVSSRVNDARSAQQIGALIILPLAALLVLQLMGAVALTTSLLLAIAGGLVVLNAALIWIGMALFARESILTRWV
jgi:ABC-2 type transport system permease protein